MAGEGAGEMGQWVRTWTILLEEPSSFPAPIGQLTALCDPSSRALLEQELLASSSTVHTWYTAAQASKHQHTK